MANTTGETASVQIELPAQLVESLHDYEESYVKQSELEEKGLADPDDWANVDDDAHWLLEKILVKLPAPQG